MRDDARVAHVVRDFGGLTEPFITQRVRVGGDGSELWYESLRAKAPLPARRIDTGWLTPGSLVERAFLHVPQVGPRLAGGYAAAEDVQRPDLIHAHYLATGYLVGRRTRAPLVVSTYGYDVTVLPRRPAWRHAIAELTKRAGAVIVEGPAMAKLAASLGFDGARIHLVPIAGGLDDVSMRPARPSEGPVRLVACGRFVEKKGLDLAIRAFGAIRAELPPGSTLDIVGAGPLEAFLRSLAGDLVRSGAVVFRGTLDRAEWLGLLADADLLLAPSRWARNGDGEGGAPTTILDAQATGVPVLGSRHADIPFLVADAVTGYLVAEDDAAALAAGILRAIADRDAWPAIIARAHVQVRARHSDAAVTDELRIVHATVAGSRA